MASIAPSQLFCYKNKAILDDLALNACDSEGNWRKPRIPAELLYEPFQKFLRDARIPLESIDDPRLNIPHNAPVDKQKFMKDVISLVECVAARYTLEEDLSDRLNNIFSSLLGVSVRRRLTPRARADREGNADGAYEATGIGQGAFVLIREDKLGTGSGGGDSLVELFGHYANILNFSNMPPPAPLVLVEVLGPRLIVSLAACDDVTRPSASPAIVSHSLVVQANPTGQITALAGSMLALRQLVTTITLQKDNLPPPLLSEDNRFAYNLVFRTPENGFHKYLRSNESYGFDVHAWCSARGFAPRFNLVEMTCQTWRRVEMLNPGDREWSLAHSIHDDDAQLQERVLAAVRNVVGQMHGQGFVHGDLRAANTLYCAAAAETTMTECEEEEISVLLIDFNSSGRAGTARYAFLPFRIAYAPEAAPGGLVTAEHDRWRLETIERFFS